MPDPPVTGLSTVRLVSDVPGVLALAHEELPFEELNTHITRDREEVSCEHRKPRPALGPKSSRHTLRESQVLGQVRDILTVTSPVGTPSSRLLGAESLERKERS